MRWSPLSELDQVLPRADYVLLMHARDSGDDGHDQRIPP